MMTGKSHLTQTESCKESRIEYDDEMARVITIMICEIKDRVYLEDTKIRSLLVTTYGLISGLKKFGDQGTNSVIKEMKQLLERECFHPIHKYELKEKEKK